MNYITSKTLAKSTTDIFQIQTRRNLTSIVTNGLIVLGGTVVAQGLSIITTLWIARLLGPDAYGVFVLALSVISIFLPEGAMIVTQ